jgi:biopolymer transport protein ExbD
MVTAHFMINKGLRLELPKAATTEKLQNQRNFNIAIYKNGSFMLDGKFVTLEKLKKAARQAKAQKLKVVAFISADKNAFYHSIISVMDTLRAEGVFEFAFQLETLKPQK